MLTATKVFNALWDNLKPREREVLAGRFDAKPLTLAALGKKYGVTRERIRQIETAGLQTLRKAMYAHPALSEALEKIKKHVKELGGAAPRDRVLAFAEGVINGLSGNQLDLIVEAAEPLHPYLEDKDFRHFYYLDKSGLKALVGFVSNWVQFVRGKKDDVLEGRYHEYLKGFIRRRNVPEAHAENFLAASKKVGANVFGDTGLTEWAEIHPKTIRDRVYLVLRKKREPLHFRTIAETINKAGFGKREASAPTVHNELIKDERFVLVGRGMYGLSEYGYEPGTAREVIHRILKKRGALKPREIMSAMQKERFFKPNTILVNLQNKTNFERLPNGAYRIREA